MLGDLLEGLCICRASIRQLGESSSGLLNDGSIGGGEALNKWGDGPCLKDDSAVFIVDAQR